MLHRESTEEYIASITTIERRADLCVEHLNLTSIPCHIAVWTVLTATISMVEENYDKFGPDSSAFKAAMINLGRYCPMVIRWVKAKSKCCAPSDWVPEWNPALGLLARNDLMVVHNYDAFQCSYPMWYRDRVHAEILDSSSVRFTVDGGGRERQVSAYHKGLRPLQGSFRAIPGKRIEPGVGMLRRYQRILAEATARGQYGFNYEHPYELAKRTYAKYVQRLESIMRRSDEIDLGGYSLAVFKRFYAALQAISAIHEYLCFCWAKWDHPYPLSSAVLLMERQAWVKLLAYRARIGSDLTEKVINDLTFSSKRLPDLHVYPFVPLDESHQILALIPHFILNSAPEDNILRVCSYLRPQVYDLLSNDKAVSMRETLVQDLRRFNVDHSIDLPDGSTEIDLLVEDESSSTLLIAELKWYRKPSTYRERLKADEQFLDGVRRQLRTIKEFCRKHPKFLLEQKKLKREVTEYDHVYYIMIARDHWIWIEPEDETSVVDFEQFRSAITRHQSLNDALSELLNYEWLPVEGRDFHVRFDSGFVEGVRAESEVFYGGPAPTR